MTIVIVHSRVLHETNAEEANDSRYATCEHGRAEGLLGSAQRMGDEQICHERERE
jgi:hypothetical protein